MRPLSGADRACMLQENSTKYRVKGSGRRLRNGGVIGQVPFSCHMR